MNDYKLNTNWDLWYHSIEDNNWGNESYKSLYKIRNLHDIQFLKENIQQNYLQNAMFFIMREDIFPTWEDPDNVVYLLKFQLLNYTKSGVLFLREF